MPRIIINGEEVRSPLARLVLLVVLILLGLGTAVALIAFALALLIGAVMVPWAIVSALLRRSGRGGRW